MAGGYDPKTNTVYWGTANPAPLYDWGGADWKTKGARPGDNLYTTSVIALDPDTGKLKSYFQEMPHDAWDFDSAVGEFVMLERGGKEYIVHPNKGGFVFVYDRNLKVQNVWQGVKNINFVKSIDPKTGELIGRRDLAEGKHQALCPYIAGGYQLERWIVQPGYRPLLQGRQRVVHGPRGDQDDAYPRAHGAAQHRLELHRQQDHAGRRKGTRPRQRRAIRSPAR